MRLYWEAFNEEFPGHRLAYQALKARTAVLTPEEAQFIVKWGNFRAGCEMAFIHLRGELPAGKKARDFARRFVRQQCAERDGGREMYLRLCKLAGEKGPGLSA